ncbi:Uncharacterised protein [Serratia marcescens]|nr:Uncharacterised protein [Serratia marcescens]CVB27847.1 Uncharacterised protein [Serratia marcescens]CVB28172.1 Uncharacterised protein [Serratia marcescens]CVB81512.1 Uncharacterised protein [Serratia marcescens]CVB82880.1 Uncharacterised protein [Serratia marcescens]
MTVVTAKIQQNTLIQFWHSLTARYPTIRNYRRVQRVTATYRLSRSKLCNLSAQRGHFIRIHEHRSIFGINAPFKQFIDSPVFELHDLPPFSIAVRQAFHPSANCSASALFRTAPSRNAFSAAIDAVIIPGSDGWGINAFSFSNRASFSALCSGVIASSSSSYSARRTRASSMLCVGTPLPNFNPGNRCTGHGNLSGYAGSRGAVYSGCGFL